MPDLDRSAIVTLPMYDWPEVQWATDRLWTSVSTALAHHGLTAPQTLDRSVAVWDAWRSPRLLVSQTCSVQVVAELASTVEVVATPNYAAAGVEPGTYHSVIVVGPEVEGESLADLAGTRLAYNEPTSLSGCLTLWAEIAEIGGNADFFTARRMTGSHRQSLRLVADGGADVAAVDAVCWALALRHMPETVERLRVVDRSRAVPAPPFITPHTTDPATRAILADALADGIAALGPEARDALMLSGCRAATRADYAPVATRKATADAVLKAHVA